MKAQSSQIFAWLLETTVLQETSSALNLVRNNPAGIDLIKYAHQNVALPDNINWQQTMPPSKVPVLDWDENHTWYLMIAEEGTALVSIKERFRGGGSNAIIIYYKLNRGNKIETVTDASWHPESAALYIENYLGYVSRVYKGTVSSEWRDTRSKRLAIKYQHIPNMSKINNMKIDLVKRFKPLWIKIYQQAISDVKGAANTLLKHDAHDRLRDKLGKLERLQDEMYEIERGADPDRLKTALSNSVVLTAAHYYPEDTGEVSQSSYGRTLDPAKKDGMYIVLQRISQNDQELLGAVLAYLKKELLKI